jgi:hypothetical protein
MTLPYPSYNDPFPSYDEVTSWYDLPEDEERRRRDRVIELRRAYYRELEGDVELDLSPIKIENEFNAGRVPWRNYHNPFQDPATPESEDE